MDTGVAITLGVCGVAVILLLVIVVAVVGAVTGNDFRPDGDR